MFGLPIDEGSEHDNQSIKLSTKKGRWINNVRRNERAPLAMKAAEDFTHKNCPGIITRSLSSSYNCVGMVFSSRRTWIDPDQLQKIFYDDEYIRISEKSRLMVGDLVIYKSNSKSKDCDHIGIIIQIVPQPGEQDFKILVLSQLGADGEYIHEEDNVPPHIGNFREYFSERKMP